MSEHEREVSKEEFYEFIDGYEKINGFKVKAIPYTIGDCWLYHGIDNKAIGRVSLYEETIYHILCSLIG